jgi:trimeric autotransporter adhesin
VEKVFSFQIIFDRLLLLSLDGGTVFELLRQKFDYGKIMSGAWAMTSSQGAATYPARINGSSISICADRAQLAYNVATINGSYPRLIVNLQTNAGCTGGDTSFLSGVQSSTFLQVADNLTQLTLFNDRGQYLMTLDQVGTIDVNQQLIVSTSFNSASTANPNPYSSQTVPQPTQQTSTFQIQPQASSSTNVITPSTAPISTATSTSTSTSTSTQTQTQTQTQTASITFNNPSSASPVFTSTPISQIQTSSINTIPSVSAASYPSLQAQTQTIPSTPTAQSQQPAPIAQSQPISSPSTSSSTSTSTSSDTSFSWNFNQNIFSGSFSSSPMFSYDPSPPYSAANNVQTPQSTQNIVPSQPTISQIPQTTTGKTQISDSFFSNNNTTNFTPEPVSAASPSSSAVNNSQTAAVASVSPVIATASTSNISAFISQSLSSGSSVSLP